MNTPFHHIRLALLVIRQDIVKEKAEIKCLEIPPKRQAMLMPNIFQGDRRHFVDR